MNLPDFLTRESDGEVNISGTRIGLYHFVYDYNAGETAEMLALRYPHIPLATIHKVVAYYLENKEEVDRFMAEYQADLDRQRAAGSAVNLAELRERLTRMRAGVSAGGTR